MRLLSRWWTAALLGPVAVLLFLAAVRSQPDLYRAEAVVLARSEGGFPGLRGPGGASRGALTVRRIEGTKRFSLSLPDRDPVRAVRALNLLLDEAEASGAAEALERPARARRVPRSGLFPSLLLGLPILAAGLTAALRKALDEPIREAGDLRLRAGLAPLGVVPWTAGPFHGSRPAARALEALAADLLSEGPLGRRPRTILIAGAGEQVGKSLLTAELARAVRRLGKRVAVVDADLRHPTLHRAFGFEDRQVTVLPASRLSSRARPRPWRGSRSLRPSPAFRQVLHDLAAGHDLVLIDSPALDRERAGLRLAALADGVILVARRSVTGARSLIRARKALARAGGAVLGGVLNGGSAPAAPLPGGARGAPGRRAAPVSRSAQE